MTDLVFELSRKEERLRLALAEIVTLSDSLFTARDEIARLRAECGAFLNTNRTIIDREHALEAEVARLQEALSDQEAKTALTRVAAEYHIAEEVRYAEALGRIIEVGGPYEAKIAEAALAEDPDEDAP